MLNREMNLTLLFNFRNNFNYLGLHNKPCKQCVAGVSLKFTKDGGEKLTNPLRLIKYLAYKVKEGLFSFRDSRLLKTVLKCMSDSLSSKRIVDHNNRHTKLSCHIEVNKSFSNSKKPTKV